jgi:hypothetical protein
LVLLKTAEAMPMATLPSSCHLRFYARVAESPLGAQPLELAALSKESPVKVPLEILRI